MNQTTTPNDVVAENIKRLRGHASRKRLADGLAKMTGRPWTESTIKDLEGARSSDRGPRPVRWTELVDLAVYFGATIFDLVLPQDPDTKVEIARATRVDDYGTTLHGEPKVMTTSYVHRSDRDELGKILFRFEGSRLTPENLESLAASIDVDLAAALNDARTTVEGLLRSIDELARARKQQEAQDGIDT